MQSNEDDMALNIVSQPKRVERKRKIDETEKRGKDNSTTNSKIAKKPFLSSDTQNSKEERSKKFKRDESGKSEDRPRVRSSNGNGTGSGFQSKSTKQAKFSSIFKNNPDIPKVQK